MQLHVSKSQITSTKMSRTVSAAWKVSGLTYSKYVNTASAVLRASTNPQYVQKNKLFEQDFNGMSMRTWTDGVRGPLGN